MGELVFPASCPGCGADQQGYDKTPEFNGGYEPVPGGMRSTTGSELIRIFRCRVCRYASTPDAVWLDKPRFVAGTGRWVPIEKTDG